ncbi:hypothetical protein SELMODRAFT_180819 [Selaginella moellendorffii]|uniref:Inosine/uridine-preferring nucleoside hydrolase domain-containing protein n=1 Tax=Selaginella moellendorffii TaxID=88036 RepID=D8SLL4_SELML|nr:uridine nucleosidase 1 [Selaginella moellendorffii]EFJ14793.1 hypothetical protein SELMODRAFT_180819 [Selaginella moellendorffii]|eukprot:XP_002984283.1 uridine nucleosidase 1 [Selaginella moellendorffii]
MPERCDDEGIAFGRSRKTKIIIDADPGIDAAMAIIMALRSPEVEVIGITTIFGSAHTPDVTRNALHLLEVMGSTHVPVAEGNIKPMAGGVPYIQDFANGLDGLGNIATADPATKKSAMSACDFLVDTVSKYPGEITIVALGPLTNLSQAFQKEECVVKLVARVVVLGGSFFSSGNANPASEANVICDPEAADMVFSSGARITVIGINVSTQVVLDGRDLSKLSDSSTESKRSLHEMCKFYREWHKKSDLFDGIYVHGPTCLAALIAPSYFSYKSGALRVETLGVCRGYTLFDMGLKKWNGLNPWVGRPHVDVAWTVDAPKVLELVLERLIHTDT